MASTIQALSSGSGGLVSSGDASGILQIQTGSGPTTAITIDASQNVGVGVTPSAWSGPTAIQVGPYGGFAGSSTYGASVSSNAYAITGGWSAKYISSNYATLYLQQVSNGQHQWFTAPSGTAGNAITFTQAMTLDNSGSLGIGTTSPASGYALTAQNAGSQIRVRNTTTRYRSDYSVSTSGITSINSYDDTGAVYTQITLDGNPVVFNISGSERARIDSSGNLLVGTTSVISLGSGYNNINSIGSSGGGLIAGTSSYQIATYANVNLGGVGTIQSIPLIFLTNNTERMRLDTSGNLLVNTTAAAGAASTFKSTAGASQQPLTFWNNASSGTRIMCAFGDSTSYSEHGNINWNGTTMTLSTTSDKRLKTNIIPATNGLQKVLDTKVYSYDMEGGHSEYGVLAQEMIDILPSSVCVGEDNEDGSIKRPWSVGYEPMVPMLIKAIQELSAQVTALQAQVTALQGAK
jgi:hypothetical protein